jgi:hypothetical protein
MTRVKGARSLLAGLQATVTQGLQHHLSGDVTPKPVRHLLQQLMPDGTLLEVEFTITDLVLEKDSRSTNPNGTVRLQGDVHAITVREAPPGYKSSIGRARPALRGGGLGLTTCDMEDE